MPVNKKELEITIAPDGTVSVLLNTCGCARLELAIGRGSNSITLSWPYPSTGFVLESKSSLSLPDWQPALESQIPNNGRWEVTVSLDQPARCFRLRKP